MHYAMEVPLRSNGLGIQRGILHLANLLSGLCVHSGCIYIALPCSIHSV